MNPGGVSEEAGSTARALIDALKGQPALLAMILANMALLAFMFYALEGSAESRRLLTQQVLDNSNSIHEILKTRAIGCPPSSEYKLQSGESRELTPEEREKMLGPPSAPR